jgi:2-dehydropantoate 2-reductase
MPLLSKIRLRPKRRLETKTSLPGFVASPSRKISFWEDMMRVAVVGVGAVGGYFGGHLAHAGEDVTFVGRGKTLEALRKNGLEVDDVKDSFVVRPANATDDPRQVGPVEVVLLAVKGWQVAGAIETVRPLLATDSVVVPLMDGVEALDQLAAAFGKPRVAGGVAVMSGSVVAPGHIRNHIAHTSITIGELDGTTSPRMVRVQKAFEHAGVAASISPDITSARWQKLLLVGPWSAVGAVTRAPLGVVRSLPQTRRLLEAAMNEVAALARGRGASLPDDVVRHALAELDRGPAAGVGNMRDVLNGRPSELETEVGAVVRLGQAAGVQLPIHTFLYASLLPQEKRARKEIEFPTSEQESAKAA